MEMNEVCTQFKGPPCDCKKKAGRGTTDQILCLTSTIAEPVNCTTDKANFITVISSNKKHKLGLNPEFQYWLCYIQHQEVQKQMCALKILFWKALSVFEQAIRCTMHRIKAHS